MDMALRRKPAVVDEEDLYPAEDGIPMENVQHDTNHHALMDALRPWLEARGRAAFQAGNNFIYYELGDPRKNVGPDYYLILGARDNPERDCWRVWNEGYLLPQVVIEFISRSTARRDRVVKFAIYRDVLKVANYFIASHRQRRIEGFRLQDGVYVPIAPNPQGLLLCDPLGLYVGMHEGVARWYDEEGILLPTPREQLVDERRKAEAEAARAQEAERRAADETRRREAAEAELARLRRLLEG